MVRFFSSLLVLATVALTSTQGAVINHDAVPVWAQPAPADATQALAVKFKPELKLYNGCHPYPAVDAAGNTSGGLKTSGSQGAACSDGAKGQIYSRSGSYNGAYAIMYAWYFPKDSPLTGMGHRHDWENVVVWLDSNNLASAKIIAVSPSAHSGYKYSYPIDSKYVDNGVSAKISYKSTWPLNHELGFTTDAGGMQPLIQWEQMTAAAQNALETTDFGDANVPFKSNFQDKLAKAYFKQ